MTAIEGDAVIAYFAYGSNLCVRRLRHRVPDVRLVGRAYLDGYALRWHKRSNTDGSGKCSIVVRDDGSGTVHGALFAVPEAQKGGLDRAEGLGNGYREAEVVVRTADGERECVTYVAEATHVDDSLTPFAWYRELVVAGAEALGLPSDYVAELKRTPADRDPDPERAGRERAFLPCDEGP